MYIKAVYGPAPSSTWMIECKSYRRDRYSVESSEEFHSLIHERLSNNYHTIFETPPLEEGYVWKGPVFVTTLSVQLEDEYLTLVFIDATLYVMNENGVTIDMIRS